jgi:hypothetical protein
MLTTYFAIHAFDRRLIDDIIISYFIISIMEEAKKNEVNRRRRSYMITVLQTVHGHVITSRDGFVTHPS